MNMRSPLGKVRGLGSARDGTGHFWCQRVSAVANIPLIIFFVYLLVSISGADYARVRETLASPMIIVILAMVVGSGLFHMRLGMQVIIEDYVHHEWIKIILLILNTFFVATLFVVNIFFLLKLGFGN